MREGRVWCRMEGGKGGKGSQGGKCMEGVKGSEGVYCCVLK